MPYICEDLCKGGSGCGDPAFWRVVRDGREAIPYLVASLDDATPTAAQVPNTGGVYTKADVAMEALTEIVKELRPMEIVGTRPSPECGGCSWWKFVRGPAANRRTVKSRIGDWLEKRSSHLQWRSESTFAQLDCVNSCAHPAGGHYYLP